ncbi:MAG: T9SS type A sorting domain-containing protein [Ignavibacteriae bacterium]|nr:T9SS type A sorting domain-containing protein [Ignavibacteriota bacterium]
MQNEITLRPYYPNPFKPAGIEFELPEQAEITLEVFDKNGKPHKTIYEKETMINGTHKLDLNSFHLDEGEYTLRLSANIFGKEFRTAKNIVIGK